MAGEAAARGRGSRLYGKFQSDFGTPGAGNFQALNFYSESLSAADTLEDDQELGNVVDNERDQTDPAEGLKSGAGAIEIPADFNQLEFWLRGLLGAPTVSGTGDLTHVYQSGADDLPVATLEVPIGGDRYKQAVSVGVNSMTFGTAKEGGFRKFSADLLAKQVSIAGASIAGVPVAIPSRAKMPAARAICRINGTITASLSSGDLTIANNLEPIHYVGDSDTADAFEPGDLAVSFNPTFRLKRGAALNGILDVLSDPSTPFALEVEYPLDATKSLLIAMPRCFAPETTPVIPGAGPVEISPPGAIMAKQVVGGSAAPAVTVTLKNQVQDLGV